jgi:ADP-ribosylglycohydrolase
MNKQKYNEIKYNVCVNAFLGLAIGDALGVPVEFKSRIYLKKSPITDMIGFGTHDVSAGTWSDDSSLTFCLAEAIIEGYTIDRSAEKLVKWYSENYWTADGNVFDIGNTTLKAIVKLRKGIPPLSSGLSTEQSNGNGSLMRMTPLIFLLKNKPIEYRYKIIKEESAITHAHDVSVIACFYFVEFGIGLLDGKNKFEIYKELQNILPNFLKTQFVGDKEIKYFERLFLNNILEDDDSIIFSTGFVIHTLTAAIWCVLTTVSYEEAVLKAVNLGEDTDTTASVVGSLAGIIYGSSQLPEKW